MRARDVGLRMMQTRVYIVAADPGIRGGLQRTLKAAGYPTRSFASGIAFLQACARLPAGCVILDLALPGPGALEALREFAAAGYRWPVLALATQAERGAAVGAPRAGSVSLLDKPVPEERLLAAVLDAQALLRGAAAQERERALAQAVALLTAREHEVLDALLASERIKQTAARLGVAESTVKSCRKTIKRKLGAHSTAQLIQLVMRAGIVRPARP